METTANKAVGLIHGLSYAYPTSGVIRLGYTRTSTKGARLPVKDDEMRLTTKVKDDKGEWMRHPLDAKLRELHGEEQKDGNTRSAKKLRQIPVTVVFDRPELNMVEQYAAFSQEGVPLCVGNGQNAKRRQRDGSITEETCVGANHCQYGKDNRCDAFLRLLVRVEGQSETEPPLILRTGSVNAVTDNRAVLEHWHAMFGGRLAGLPFRFVLDAKQTALSRQSVFYFGRLEPAFGSIAEGARLLRDQRKDDAELGIDRAAAENALLALRRNGAFAEDSADDGEQFDDLLAGRFISEIDGEQRNIQVTGSRGSMGIETPPAQAASHAVLALSQMLSSAGAANQLAAEAAA